MTKDTCPTCGVVSFDDPDEALAWLKEPTIEQMIEEMGGVYVKLWDTGWGAIPVVPVPARFGTPGHGHDSTTAAITALYEKWKATQ